MSLYKESKREKMMNFFEEYEEFFNDKEMQEVLDETVNDFIKDFEVRREKKVQEDRKEALEEIKEKIDETLAKYGAIHLWDDENPWLIQLLVDKELEKGEKSDEVLKAIEHTRGCLNMAEEVMLVDEETQNESIEYYKLVLKALETYQPVGNDEKLGCKCKQAVCLNGTAYCSDCGRKL